MATAPSSATQHTVVARSTYHPVLCLASMEPTTSSVTQQEMLELVLVVQSMHSKMLCLVSMEPTTSSVTQQIIVVVQSRHQAPD